MEGNKEYLREKRKSILREGMISSSAGNPGGNRAVPGTEKGAAGWKRIPGALPFHLGGKFTLIGVLAAVLLLAAFIYNVYQQNKTYDSYSVIWQKSLEGGSADYTLFGGLLLKYSKDGVICYSQSGEQLWNQSYEMKAPMIHICEGYAVIADQMGYSFYICSLEGCTGQASTNLPITRVQVASQGVVAAILEDTRSNQIVFYDKTGKKLDIELKTLLEEYGYPMDIALSPDGQQLAVAYIYMDAGTMMNKVVFYNFEVGKSKQDRVVGIFMEYRSAMIGQVDFLDNETACAFADDRVDFYSLKNALSPSLMQSQTYDGREILSVFSGKKYAGVIVEADTEESDRHLYVYNSSGALVFDKPVKMSYTRAEMSGSFLLLYNDTNCLIYDMGGGVVYQGSLEGSISKCLMKSRSRLYQVGGQIVSELKLN